MHATTDNVDLKPVLQNTMNDTADVDLKACIK